MPKFEEIENYDIILEIGDYTIDILYTENILLDDITNAHVDIFHELHYFVRGSGFYSINQKKIPIMPGAFFMTLPGCEHSIWNDPNCDTEMYNIFLKVKKKPVLSNENKDSNLLCKMLFDNQTVSTVDDGKLLAIYSELFGEYRNKYIGHVEKVKNCYINLFVTIARQLDREASSEFAFKKSTPVSQTLTIIKDYITKLESDPKYLAKLLGVSERQLERIIKSEYGMSFGKLVNTRKILVAKDYLINSDYSINTIAEKSKFTSPENMTITFKHYEGITPSVYRKNHKSQ